MTCTTQQTDRWKVIALDLDGTVLDRSGNVPELFPRAVEVLDRMGVTTVLCTGRRWRTASPKVEGVGHAHSRAVCCGGALIKDCRTHASIHRIDLKQDLAETTCRIFRESGLVPFVLHDCSLSQPDLLLGEVDLPRAEKLAYIQRNREYVSYYAGESPPEKNPILEVYTVDRASRIKEREHFIREQLEAECRITAINQPLYGSDFWALEVHAPSATKWTALKRLLEEWNVPSTQVIAMGDDVNDIPMLEEAGLSFAMGNAVEEVKNVVDRITETNHQEGVLKALLEVFPELSEQLLK